jgi:ABC-2 type transport system ATP-binding protein
MTKQPIIQVNNLRKVYTYHRKQPGLWGSVKAFFHREILEKEAVKGISFDIDEGEFVGFIGPNGAGKTTTLKMFSGVLYPSGGSANVLGYTPYERKHNYLEQMAFIMGQKSSLFWSLPAMELFLLICDIYEIPKKRFKKSLGLLSNLLDAKDFLDIQVRKLSLGQRMKCELIAGLLHMPKVLFLDEPTIGLDVVSQKMIREFFMRYNKETKATIILTSHYLEDIRSLCKRIIFIDKGVIIFDGQLNDLIERYAPDVHLTVTFVDKISDSILEKLKSLGTLKEDKEHFKIQISVKRGKSAETAKEILNQFTVSNILIEEPTLQEVVTHMS